MATTSSDADSDEELMEFLADKSWEQIMSLIHEPEAVEMLNKTRESKASGKIKNTSPVKATTPAKRNKATTTAKRNNNRAM